MVFFLGFILPVTSLSSLSPSLPSFLHFHSLPGINTAVVILLLLLSIPLQLFLSNLVALSTTEEAGERDISDARTEAVEQTATPSSLPLPPT